MQNNNEYDLETYQKMLDESKTLLDRLKERINNNKTEFSINGKPSDIDDFFSYKIPDAIVSMVLDSLTIYVADLQEIINYYYRHSTWIENDATYGFNCANCGVYSFTKSNYCPSCGFMMDIKFKNDQTKKIFNKLAMRRIKNMCDADNKIMYAIQNTKTGEMIYSARGGAYFDKDAAERKRKCLGSDYKIVRYILEA